MSITTLHQNGPVMSSTLVNNRKPKAPLSAYNLYFQLERKRILEGTDHLNLPIGHDELSIVAHVHKSKVEKRVHRKTPGMIGFKDLARHVANRWKQLDPEVRMLLEEHAVIEKEDFNIRMEEWKQLSPGGSGGDPSILPGPQPNEVFVPKNTSTPSSQPPSCTASARTPAKQTSTNNEGDAFGFSVECFQWEQGQVQRPNPYDAVSQPSPSVVVALPVTQFLTSLSDQRHEAHHSLDQVSENEMIHGMMQHHASMFPASTNAIGPSSLLAVIPGDLLDANFF